MTYTDLSQALYQFWSQFVWNGSPIPVYKQGYAEKNVFPCITFSVSMGDFDGTSIQSAFVWCKQEEGMNVNAQRASIIDQIARQIPPVVGRIFKAANGGAMWIGRNVDFVSDYSPPEGEDESTETDGEPVIGGRISYTVRTY